MEKIKGWFAAAAKDPLGTSIDVGLWVFSAAIGIWFVKFIGIWALGLIGVT